MAVSRARSRALLPLALIAIILGLLLLCLRALPPRSALSVEHLSTQPIWCLHGMPSSFKCLKSCGRQFDKQTSLNIHQSSCEVYRKSQQLASEKRRARYAEATKSMTDSGPRKKLRSELPVQTSMGVGTSSQAMLTAEMTDVGDDSTNLPDYGATDADMTDLWHPPADSAADFGMINAVSATRASDESFTPSVQPVLTPAGLPYRTHRLPARYRDDLPEVAPAATLDPHMETNTAGNERSHLPRVLLIVRDSIASAVNSFGLWREYPHRPSRDPDESIALEDLATTQPAASSASDLEPTSKLASLIPPWPFPNMTQFLFMRYHNRDVGKSDAEGNFLLREVIGHPEFKKEDLEGFSVEKGNRILDQSEEALQDTPWADGFKEASVEIEVPSGDKNVRAEKLAVSGLHYRSIVSVIKAAFSEKLALQFHFSPFKLWHRSDTSGQEERVYSEIYNSDAFIQEHDKIQRHAPADPDDPECKLEKVVAALMFWSDSTHLANFGTAKAWPIYMLFGNLSKYIRARPNLGACHHIAYIPSLPDSAHDWLSGFHRKWASQRSSILTLCRRELMHSIWNFLLDDEFIHAYTYGIIVDCADGIRRRVFPRIFTYSADYPEKVLLAAIRDKGLCPCPRCMVSKSVFDRMGLMRDLSSRITRARHFLMDTVMRARNLIYVLAYPIGAAGVERLLKPFSATPTINAFVNRLGPAFNVSRMLVPDFMHEFELGVWKTVFAHLMRLLHAAKAGAVNELDRRYRQVPTFGRRTIRRFSVNASEMKKMAARDYEDLLQCAIPVFEGLFPEPHNTRLMTLLYTMAHWHALAKMRMHTDSTLAQLEKVTTELGRQIRKFRDLTCSRWRTVELESEARARQRRAQATGAQAGTSTLGSSSSSQKTKNLNLLTYKFHALGDYVPNIKLFGTSDSYSTQLGELAHRTVKRLYAKTNKREASKQIAKKHRRKQRLDRAEATHAHHVPRHADQGHEARAIELHHHLSASRNFPIALFPFVQHGQDPAKAEFIPKLQDHLLGRLLGREFDGDTHEEFSHADRNSVRIVDNKIFAVKTLKVNYTTYDIRRDYDTINPRTRADVMVKSPEAEPDAHPYWYARVLGVFHANVWTTHPHATDKSARRMEFLWVRWFGEEPEYTSGPRCARLPKIGFVPDSDPYAFGFLDPAHVIRGSHLIPAFAGGRTTALLRTEEITAARALGEKDDWMNYYVGIFVDRDMATRYLGGGVGHTRCGGIVPVTMDRLDDGETDAGEWEDIDEHDVAASPDLPETAANVESDSANQDIIEDEPAPDDSDDDLDPSDEDADLDGDADADDSNNEADSDLGEDTGYDSL